MYQGARNQGNYNPGGYNQGVKYSQGGNYNFSSGYNHYPQGGYNGGFWLLYGTNLLLLIYMSKSEKKLHIFGKNQLNLIILYIVCCIL